MGKWAARLAEKSAVPPRAGTDKADKRGLVSVVAVVSQGGAGDFQTAPLPVEAAQSAPASPDLSAVAWTDGDIAGFIGRRARLVRWGWPEADAETLAERLMLRDRSADDERVNCTDCRHYRPGRCSNHRAARLNSAEVGRDLAALLQRCPGFGLREVLT